VSRVAFSSGVTLASSLLLLAWSCADAGMTPSPDRACTSSSGCPHGLLCSFDHCVVSDQNRLTLKARITPPATSGLVAQQLPTLALDDGPDRLVQLLAPALVRGTVKPRDNPLISNIEGELELRTEGDIAGLDFVFSAHSLAGLDLEGFGYRLSLLPGRSYAGTFRPTDKNLPRHVFRLDLADVGNGRFDVTLPGKGDYLTLSGRVMKRDYTPIGGARLVVLSADNEVAAVTTSEPVRGLWQVLVAPGLTAFSLKVESPADGPMFPEFSSGPLTYADDDTIDLIVPALAPGPEPIEATLAITERKAAATSETALAPPIGPAIGRAVTIEGVLAGGTLRRTGTTNDQGEVTFQVLPGAYECLVASPPQAAAATWHGFVNLTGQSDQGGGTAAIELAPRVRFVGHVTDTFGLPVEAGRLTFERQVEPRDGRALFIAPAPFEALLGSDGVFTALVDPGTYEVRVAPDPLTGAPNALQTDLVVGPDGLRLELGLPPPGLLHLTVAGPDGIWIAGAQVELWQDDDLGLSRLLALGSTGPDGFVDILVPHRGARLEALP